MMLSDIQNHWPPTFPDVSGEEITGDPQVGHRTTFGQIVGVQREALYELHEGAWWTGCRFAVPADEPSRTIRCQILTNGGAEVFSSWTQETGDWTPFSWPIPAAFARAEGLVLTVELAEEVNPPVYLSRRIAFQEMPGMPREHRYMFVDDEGHARIAWDGFQEEYVSRDGNDGNEGPQPRWNVPYTLVPPTDYLATGRPWSMDRVYSPMNWQEVGDLGGV
jgi:hypothetical protein